MTTTSAVKNHRSLPRQKRPPSARDQAILVAYRTQGRSQAELAGQYNLSQRRISQIIRRTQHWLDHGIPVQLTAAPGGYGMALPSSDSLERQRLERRLARERDQAIFDRALYRHDHQPEALVTTATHDRPAGKTTSETRRQLAPSGQFLRAALRASAELKRTESQEPLETPPVEMDPHQKLALLLNLLCAFRREAEQEHKVVKTDDKITIVEQWLAALLGDLPCSLSDEDLAPGSPLAELSEFYPRFLRSLKTPDPEPEELPASSPINVEPETCNEELDASSNCSNSSNPSSTESTLTPSPSTTSPPKTEDRKLKTPSPNPEPQTLNAYQRRLEHERKLEQLKEARRLGLPYHFVFDPEDGPLPPPPRQPGDFHIVVPGPY